MIKLLKETLWNQFGASIEMLTNAIAMCPEENWNNHTGFFYTTYHCLLFLDYYLTIPPENFSSPFPFIIAERDNLPVNAIDDLIPEKFYRKKEMLDYAEKSRNKCYQLIQNLTEEKLSGRWINKPDEIVAGSVMNYSVLEILLFNMRHVQHHSAQLNLLLRQAINDAPHWVSQASNVL
ncbi:MAG TPA: DinB family protein [Puia sp.]|nr:DinB family protein [Puia sp.]